eukprot:COSAG01_NODE_41675_length_448_cov_2.375358_1_plen_105_part_10
MVQPLRFHFDGTKNNATMELETRVTLGLHATEVPLGYTLCAVIVHSGRSLLTGHYWSYSRMDASADGPWLKDLSYEEAFKLLPAIKRVDLWKNCNDPHGTPPQHR